ncbi:hypothetical protein VTK56DRAFT_7873 [Thermocarpiscus australiensis]
MSRHRGWLHGTKVLLVPSSGRFFQRRSGTGGGVFGQRKRKKKATRLIKCCTMDDDRLDSEFPAPSDTSCSFRMQSAEYVCGHRISAFTSRFLVSVVATAALRARLGNIGTAAGCSTTFLTADRIQGADSAFRVFVLGRTLKGPPWTDRCPG